MKFLDTYKGLPKSVYVLFCVQVINRFGDFVFPFLSLLLTQKLKLSFGVTGIVVMSVSLVIIPASLIGGRYADKVSRKKTYLVGQFLAALCILICSIVSNPVAVVVLLIISSFFNGFVKPTISAMMADILPPEKRQTGSALLYLGINIGVALGPMVAGFLFNNFLPLLFIGDALTSFIAVTIVCLFIGETKPVHIASNEKYPKGKPSKELHERGSLLKALRKRPTILCFLLISIVYSFVYKQSTFSLPIMMDKVFSHEGSQKFGILMSVNAISVLFLTLIVVNMTNKFKELTNMIFAGIFYIVGFGMIGFIGGNYVLFIASTVLWTIGEILSATNKGVYVANNSPENFRARFSSMDYLCSALGGAFGTFLMGSYMDRFGVKSVWTLISIMAFGGAFLMTLLRIYDIKRGCEREKSKSTAA